MIKLFTESTVAACGSKPTKQQAKEFFQNHQAQFKVLSIVHSQPKPSANGGTRWQNGKPSSLTFQGTEYSVKTWKEVLVKLCELIYAEKQDEFDHIMSIQGTKNLYFSRNRDDLSGPAHIGDSGIFAATSPLNKSQVKERCRKVMDKFGYSEDLLEIA